MHSRSSAAWKGDSNKIRTAAEKVCIVILAVWGSEERKPIIKLKEVDEKLAEESKRGGRGEEILFRKVTLKKK